MCNLLAYFKAQSVLASLAFAAYSSDDEPEERSSMLHSLDRGFSWNDCSGEIGRHFRAVCVEDVFQFCLCFFWVPLGFYSHLDFFWVAVIDGGVGVRERRR